MDLIELKEYPHKIIKINVTNKNGIADSISETALLKITLSKEDNEIILFSYDESLTQPIPRSKKGDDYFVTMKNVEGVTVIYAHFLMADLYDSTEEDEDSGIIVDYNLKQLKGNATYNVSDDDHPKVSSILAGSIHKTGEKDPNYKQYNIDTNATGKPLKGRFPISSRYSNLNKQLIAPDVNSQTPNTQFTRDDNVNTPKREWEVRIKREDIGDIIPKDTGRTQYPINVFLNYEYLPSSTEYHQHFYGFEGESNTEGRDINVFEGDNLETINGAFFNNDEKYTYRLINWGNKFDHTNAFYADRNAHIVPLQELSDPIIINDTCDWIRNECENYFVYTALSNDKNRGLYYPITLKANTSYILKYYVYVPNDIVDNDYDCYIEIQSIDDYNGNIIDAWCIDDIFKQQDKVLTNRWVYHEVPFQTTVKNHHIYIKGHTHTGKDVYFGNIYIQENVQYSPTIKYTNQGVFVVEGNGHTSKPNTDYQDYTPQTYTNKPPVIADVTEPNTPYNDIFIDFDENFDIEYRYKILSCYPNDGYTLCYRKEINQETNEEEWNLYINDNYNKKEDGLDSNGAPILVDDTDNPILTFDNEKNLCFNYQPKQRFTYGTNNSFKLRIGNEHREGVSNGFVECAITQTKNCDENIKASTKYLGKKYSDDNGNVEYTRLNFTKIPKDGNKYLRIDYTHPCFEKTICVFKKVAFVEESIEMTITAEEQVVNNTTPYTVNNIGEFPLKVVANVHQSFDTEHVTDWGYCELSIDDEVKQTSYVNANGLAEFFLNKNADGIKKTQTVKIEYYREYNVVKAYDFFTLNLAEDFDGRDAVPIRFNILTNQENNVEEGEYPQSYIEQGYIEQIDKVITIQKDDCLIIDIDADTEKYINYSIRLYKNNKEYITFSNNKTYINITSADTSSIVIGDYIDDKDSFTEQTIKYTIVTDSLIKNIDATTGDITYSNSKYRKYEKHMTVTWTEA